MLLSVVIPAFNEEDILGASLERIKQALREDCRDGLDWEIVVCDNNSTDSTADVARAAGARVVSETLNQISRARNTGAAAAQGDWLLFIDADSYPSTELVEEVLDLIADGGYVGCGSTVVVNEGTLLNKLRMERLNPFFRLLGLCGGVFILCRREAFRAVGGFSITLFALEEIEFVIRLKKYGRRVGLRFAVLHRHPVVTSGRKVDYGLISFGRMCVSNIAAVVLLILSYLLPPKLMPKTPSFLLDYWYGRRH